jgi:glycosyltransferase involved in cell wall biosynthesis
MNFLSAAMIVRDEDVAQVDLALACIRSLVDEIVVIDTGSKTPHKPDLADVFEIYTGCNDRHGQMIDFAAARNTSFSRTRGQYIVWLDADDILRGEDSLPLAPDVLRKACKPNKRILYPYQYVDGMRFPVVRVVPRETTWFHPIHEFIPTDHGDEKRTDVVWWHGRRNENSERSSRRNLRIGEYWKENPKFKNDSRFLFYLGQSYQDMMAVERNKKNDLQAEELKKRAIRAYTRSYNQVDGWADQRFITAQRMAMMVLPSYSGFLEWAWKAVQARPDWPNGYFMLGKAYYHLMNEEPDNAWSHALRSIQFFEMGLSLPKAETISFVDTDEDRVEIHRFYNMVLNRVGRVEDALKSCEKALACGNDEQIKANLTLYKAFLAKCKYDESMREMQEQYGRGNPSADAIVSDALHLKDKPTLRKPNEGPHRIAFVCSAIWDVWNPDDISMVKGSEIALVEVAKRLARDGADVRVYSPSCGSEKSYDRVRYIPRMPSASDESCETLVAFRHADLLQSPLRAGQRVLWMHDVSAPNASRERWTLADFVFVNALFHRSSVMAWHAHEDLDPRKIFITGAMMDAARFEGIEVQRQAHKCIWTSSPDRGLIELLTFWPRIVEAVSDATLHVYYGFAGWHHTEHGRHMERIIRLAIEQHPSVVLHGSVSREEHARELLTAGVWLYTSYSAGQNFYETGCVSAMEALAAGVFPVCSAWGAILEVMFRHGRMVDGEIHSAEYQDKFVRYVIEALNDDGKTNRRDLQVFARQMFDVESVIYRWRTILGIEKRDPNERPKEPDGEHRPTDPGLGSAAGVPDDFESDRPPATLLVSDKPMVAIVCGESWETWNPDTARKDGIGGSETAVIELSKRWAKLGYDVTVYAKCDVDRVYDGVRWVPEMRPVFEADVAIAWRRADLLSLGLAKKRILWLHDACVPGAAPEFLRLADAVMVNTKWHGEKVGPELGEHAHKLIVIPPGIDPSRFEYEVERNVKKVVWTSAPERGLNEILDMWPKIVQLAPDAQLHVLYGFQTWELRAKHYGEIKSLERIAQMRAKCDSQDSVFLRGRVSSDVYPVELLSAGAWLYPSWLGPEDVPFHETYCVSAAEALAAGLRILCNPIGGLAEVIDGFDYFNVPTPSDPRSALYQHDFVEMAADLLNLSYSQLGIEAREDQMKKARAVFGWDAVAKKWIEQF